jgi:hypothetical protein
MRGHAYLRSLREFLVGGKYLWIGLAAIAVASAVAALSPDPITGARWVGLALQVLGMLGLFGGLIRLHDHYRSPRFWPRVRMWLSLPVVGSKPKHHVMKAEPGTYVLTGGDVRARVSARSDAPLESKLNAIAQNLQIIDHELSNFTKSASSRLDSLASMLASVAKDSRAELDQLSERVQQAQIGDLGREMTSLWLILAGVVFATVPECAGPVSAGMWQSIGVVAALLR